MTKPLGKKTTRACLAGGAILILALAASTANAAGVYKWVGPDGKVQFSDKPPPGVEAETIKTKTSSDAENAERLNKFKDQADESFKKRQEVKAAAREEKAKADEMKAHCKKVRGELDVLVNSTRRQFINDQGEREFVDEDRRQEWMQIARDEIAKNCK